MPKLLNLVLSGLFLIIHLPLFAVIKPLPGYYINNNGDSVLCDFEFTDPQMTPQNIVATVRGEKITLTPFDIKRFSVYGYGVYISAQVSYSMSEISSTRLTDNYSDSIEASQRFLKVITEGMYSLYELKKPQRSWYFVSHNSSNPTELIYRVRKKQMLIEEDARYRNVLFDLLTKEGVQHTNVIQLSKARYTSGDINAIISKLNAKYPSTERKARRQAEINIDIFAGGVNNYFPSAFHGRFSADNSFESSTSPSTGINFVFVLPANFKRFAVGASAGYNSYKSATAASGSFSDSAGVNFHSTTTFTEKFYIEDRLLQLNLYGRYTINPLSQIKVYLKAGLNCNISIGKSEGMFTEYTSERKGVINGNLPIYQLLQGADNFMQHHGMYYNFRGDIGIMADRHKLEFAYFTPVALNANAPFTIRMIGAYYYFTVFK